MFDIRKIQEQVIYGTVKNASNAETAKEIVYGKDKLARTENNSTWVKSTMKRLENYFDKLAVNQIRMNCQCGYGMDEKFSAGERTVSIIVKYGGVWKIGQSESSRTDLCKWRTISAISFLPMSNACRCG